MLLYKILALLLALFICCCMGQPNTAGNTTDCDTLRARCRICVRSINEGPDEDNMFGRLNRRCQEKVGRLYVWRDLHRCDTIHLRCRGIDRKLNCTALAELAGMLRRLS